MSISNWYNITSAVQGDVSYNLRKSFINSVYVDLELVAFSEEWDQFDVALEYRIDNREEWIDNAVIISTTASYLKGNKLYGLAASKEGITHSMRWKYSENGLLYGSTPEIRIRVLPRVRIFSMANERYAISSLYGESMANMDGLSNHKCIGIDHLGRYMCLGVNRFNVFSLLNDEFPLYFLGGLSTPNYGIQINSGRYIISDPGNFRVIEADSTLSSILKSYTIAGSAFFDYSEENETLLITSESLNSIEEITWSDIDNGNVIWQSNYALNSPQCATYKQGDNDKIIIADTGNNAVIKYDKNDNVYVALNYYRINAEHNGGVHEISKFNSPFRVYWYLNDDICTVEKEGVILDWDIIDSSSSSSS